MRSWLVIGSMLVSASLAQAEDAKVEGVHLCCGACVKAVNSTLEGIDGVSGVTVDKDGGSVTFTCTDRAAARRGVAALAAAGFGGSAEYAGKRIRLPSGAQADAEGSTVKLSGVHNCCPGCADAITGALGEVDGVKDVTCDGQNCTVTGTDVSHMDLLEALHAAGLHATVAAE